MSIINSAQVVSSAYSSEFLMYSYKVDMCTREDNHDWARCPFAHEKEKAKRRDPRRFKYASLPCPDTMQGRHCPRGDACPYTHSVQEYWLHPDRFKTQICKNGAHCTRPLCFFAHRADELRFPDTDPIEATVPLSMADAPTSDCDAVPILPGLAAYPVPAAAAGGRAEAAAPHLTPALLAALSAADVAPAPCAMQQGPASAAGPLIAPPSLQAVMPNTPAPLGASDAGLLVGLGFGMHAPLNLAAAAAVQQQQQQQHLRAYLEQQQRAVQQQRATLEQQHLALELWRQQLQQRETVAGYGAARGMEEPTSPLSVAPRIASNTSTTSHFTSSMVFGDVDLPLAPAPSNGSFHMFPAATAAAGRSVNGLFGGGTWRMQQQAPFDMGPAAQVPPFF